jgi:alpha-1,2-mannosyltransferase
VKPNGVLRRSSVTVFYVLVVVCLAIIAAHELLNGKGIDFDANIWSPGKDVLAGRSPYPQPELSQLVRPFFLYPPLLLGIGVPWSLLPHDVGRALFFAAEVAVVVASLRLVGVRDRRILLWGVLSYPVFDALLLGNPSLLLLLPVACAWRWRDHGRGCGVAVGLAGAFKLLAWPLGVWLIATRRLRAAALAVAIACVAVIVPWALIGFDGLTDYRKIAEIYTQNNGGPRAITIAGLAHTLGLTWGVGHVIQWAAGLALIGAAVRVAARRRPGADLQAFSLTLVAALVLSPVVWIHYLALLLVPLAIARPIFDRAWVVVCALWVFPLLPANDAHKIVVNGHVLASAGAAPTLFELGVGLAFMGFVVAVVAARTSPAHAAISN